MILSESRLRKIIREEIRNKLREQLSDDAKRAAGAAISGIKTQSDSIRASLLALKRKLDIGGNIDTAPIDDAIKKYDQGETDSQEVLDDIESLSRGERVEPEGVTEGSEKATCFDHDEYKTFDRKSGCIQKAKKLSKDEADAYVAKVLRDKGEIK